MLIDIHAHFYQPDGQRADWAERNASRLATGVRIGVDVHVASILGSWGRRSPTYFPSAPDVVAGNDALQALIDDHPGTIRGYACVNPNYTEHAVAEIERCVARGFIGVKLAASRRADDVLLDPVCTAAHRLGLPVLHHIWQHRRREWGGQEASDAVELVRLAVRHRDVPFILAHIGGGGDWSHTLHAVRDVPNVLVDLSGSGVDGGMLEACVQAVGCDRLLWGCDLTMDTGVAKLRHLERIVTSDALDAIRGGNAIRIFPPGSFARHRAD